MLKATLQAETMGDNHETKSLNSDSGAVVVKAKPVRRIFKGVTRTINKIPQDIINNPQINEAMGALPQNYNFEIHKTIWRIRELKAKRVALQMPEGNLFYLSLFLLESNHTSFVDNTQK